MIASTIPVRIYETDDRIMLVAPMPGLEPEDIDVKIAGPRISIRGALRGPRQDERNLLASEWSIGPYAREVTLPQPVNGRLANATYDNGVLVLALPKADSAGGEVAAEFRLERVHRAPRGERIGHSGSTIEATTTNEHRAFRGPAAADAGAPSKQTRACRATVSLAHLAGGPKARTREAVYVVARRAVELLGGMARFVKPGQLVLLKPNQTVFRLADDGVTTDPWLVAALARLVLEAGGRPVVGDMPGAGITSKEVMAITGMDDAIREAGADIVYLDEAVQRHVDVPGGEIVQKLELPVTLFEADVLINVPKAKTHFVDPISGALKNWMGVMRPDVRMRHHDVETPLYVLDATLARPPHLHVMDALWAGEGRGPIGNRPAWVGCVLASTDPVALDVTTARLLGVPDGEAESMTYAREAMRRGLGTTHVADIEVTGETLRDRRVAIRREPVDLTFAYLAPVRVIVGDGVSLPGTIGHFKSVADVWHEDHVWDLIRAYRRGTPTIMIGRADDPDFERHLDEGPYVTIDDAVDDRYKRDPRVRHIAGHPVCDRMYRELIGALGVALPGTAALELMKVWTNLRSEVKY